MALIEGTRLLNPLKPISAKVGPPAVTFVPWVQWRRIDPLRLHIYIRLRAIMKLPSLLISTDNKTIRILRRVLGALDIAFDHSSDTGSAIQKLTRS